MTRRDYRQVCIDDEVQVGDVVYRVEDRTYAAGGYSINGEWEPSPFGPGIHVDLLEYTVDKVTSKGFWFSYGTGEHIRGERLWRSFTSTYVSRTPKIAAQNAVRRRAFHILKSEQRLNTLQRRLRALETYAEQQALNEHMEKTA
jgi:hypothetical protein